MALPIVTELTEPPVVGRYYLVPCILYRWYSRRAWWPIIGPKHDDAEHLDFERPHYHIDRRFLRESDFRREGYQGRKGRGSAWMRRYPADTVFAATPVHEHDEDGPMPSPVLRRRLCLVSDVSFPAIERAGSKFEKFHEAYEGKRCRRDASGHLICPHKGARLGSMAPDRNGIAICPLHGLAINVETGLVVRRPRGVC